MEEKDLDGFDDEVVESTPTENDGFDDEETPTGEVEESEEQDKEQKEEETPVDDEVAEGEKAEPTSEADKPETMELNILGEVKPYAIDEVKALAQKGGDYDRVKSKLSETREELEEIKEELKNYGIDGIEGLINNRKQAEIQAEIEAGVPEEKAKELVNARYEKKQEARIKAKADKEADTKSKEEAELNEFIETYPNVKPDDIPKEVFTMAKDKNISLVDAMTRHENQRLQKEIVQLKQNLENQKRAPLKGITQHGASTPKKVDKDLDGFDDDDY